MIELIKLIHNSPKYTHVNDLYIKEIESNNLEESIVSEIEQAEEAEKEEKNEEKEEE